MDTISAIKILKISVFRDMKDESLEKLCETSSIIHLVKGERLFQEGDQGETMYIVLDGLLEVYTKNKLIAERGPYSLIGEMALINSQPRSANVKASATTNLLEISKENFNTFIAPHPHIVLEIMKTLSQRSRNDLNALDMGFRELHKSQENFESIVQSVSDIIIRVSTDNIITYANVSVNLLGYTPNKMIGKPIADFLDEENKTKILEKLITKRIGLRATKDLEVWLKVNEGFQFPGGFKKLLFLVDSTGLWDVSNDIVIKRNSKKKYLGCQLIAREITLRKKAEEEVVESAKRLEELVKIRTQELENSKQEAEKSKEEAEKAREEAETAKEEAEKANMAKSNFLASMSHELRTPMNSILGFSQIMRKEAKKNNDTDYISSLDQVLKSGYHLLDLINEVLDLSKIESGNLEVSIEAVNISDLLNDILDLLKPIAEEKKIQLTKLTIDPNTHVRADKIHLKQVLINLFSNAIKYNQENGKVFVNCSLEEKDKVIIEVSDTGRGIPEDKQQGVFIPFDRLGLESGEIEGTGIGLAITKRLVEMMQGSIYFESVVGEGTSFFVELEVSKEKSDCQKELSKAPNPIETKIDPELKVILYIEDNEANLELVRRILDLKKNVLCLFAKTAIEGIQLAQVRRPDIILMDINLPDMGGCEAFEKLQESEQTKNIPVLALSADAMSNDIKKAKNLGFSDYITKPIDVPLFMDSIEKYL